MIPLAAPIEGFHAFIGAWLYRADITCLIDVGPSVTAPDLLRALRELNVGRLDYILLTHIHLDHAGAVGEIAAAFPQTPIVCHRDAREHLIDPSRLWQGTRKILGSTALSYGAIKPVGENPLLETDGLRSESVIPIVTPGHAAHHVSYQTEKYLFAGETAGVFVSLPQKRFYLRPATPPRFFLEDALQSLDALIARRPQAICYAHFGIHPEAVKMLKLHRRQLQFWEKLIGAEMNRYAASDRTSACLQRLLEEDTLLATFDQLPPDVQKREKYFLQNSIAGYLGYLSSEGR